MADAPEISNESVERRYRRGTIAARAQTREPMVAGAEVLGEETRKRARHEAAVHGAYRKTRKRRRRGRRG